MSLANQRYLIVEALPGFNRATALFYNDIDRQIAIQETWSFAQTSQLNGFLRDFKDKENCRFIFGLSSDLATTSYAHYVTLRRNPRLVIDEAELEALVSQLLWQCQGQMPSPYVCLSSLDIRAVIIDGHKAINPIGLSGREIKIYFSRTLVKKNFLDDIKKYLPLDKIMFIGEAGSFWSHVIARSIAGVGNNFLLVPIYFDQAAIFTCQDNNIGFVKEIKWGEKNLTSCIFRELAVDHDLARDVLATYCQQRASRSLLNKLSSFWANEFRELASNIEPVLNKTRINKIYFLPFFHFPLKELKFKQWVRSQLVDSRWISQKFGFQLKLNQENENLAESLSVMAALAEVSMIPASSLLNKIAQRRLRWYERTS